MLKSSSEIFRNNMHCLNRKQSPYSLHSSKNDSLVKPRKMSSASLKENMPDLQKLIMDIKISPALGNNQNGDSIKQIYKLLKNIENNQIVADEINAVYLLMQSIENKLNNKQKYRPQLKSHKKKNSIEISSHEKQLSEVSPIKQINEDTSSRIMYTNFSIKQLQKSITEENNSIVNSEKKSNVKIAVSKFEECAENQQVDKLNQQIKYLQKLLENKSKGANLMQNHTLFKKKSCGY